jgi:hypothetical protein
MRRELVVLIAACHAQTEPVVPPASHVDPPAEHGRMVVTDTSIELLPKVRFIGANLAPESHAILDAVAHTMTGNPSIELMEIDAAAPNQVLADQRARIVASYLVGAGVLATRLSPVGVVGPDELRFVILRRKP